jgi:uncharacterized coiled-coil DUF342 family protein
MASDTELKAQINKVKEQLDAEWQALDEIFKKVKGKNDEVNDYKTKRDEFNQLVKTLITEGKEIQKERDNLRETAKPKREVIKNLRLHIKEFSKQINELKDLRDGKHREAKGSIEGLKDNVMSALTTLLTLDLSLKDEITLFNMIFSTKDRYDAKLMAEDTHKQIQDTYNSLKETERQIVEQESQVTRIYADAQKLHDESVVKFREKDASRDKSNELHQRVLGGYKEIRTLRSEADNVKKNVAELKGELNILYKKLKASGKKRADMQRKEKLEGAKEKLKDKKKMGLDELRLLIESGQLDEK